MFVDYFNEFLSLPHFFEPVRFNKDIGAFEIVNDAEETLTNRIKALLYNYKPKHPVYDVIRKTTQQFLQLKPEPNPELEIDNSYIVKTLEREQGLAWVRKERLPYFLQSDCYFEYRIAKLLSQVECSAAGMKLQIDSGYRPWSVTKKISPPSSSESEMELIMRKYYASLGQTSFTQSKEWFTLAKRDQEMVTTQSLQIPLTSIQTREDLLLHQKKSCHLSISESLGMELVEDVTSRVDEDFSTADSFKGSGMASSYHIKKSKSIDDECFASVPDSPSHAPHSAFMEFRSESAIEAEKPTQLSEEKSYEMETQRVLVEEKAYASEHESLHSSELWSDEEPEDVDGEAYDDGHSIGPKYYKFLTRKAVEKFKSFLHGTLGEKYWHLWMDIERLKAIKDTRWKYSHLRKLKNNYLMSIGEYFLTSEVLSRLTLSSSSHWTEKRLNDIQPEVTKQLLLYWGPRYYITQFIPNRNASAMLKLWKERQLRPKINIDPCPPTITLLPLRAKSCIPKSNLTSLTQILNVIQKKGSGKSVRSDISTPKPKELLSISLETSKSTLSPILSKIVSKPGVVKERQRMHSAGSLTSCSYESTISTFSESSKDDKEDLSETLSIQSNTESPVLGGAQMERLLQALYHDPRAGYFFTNFCICSGNKVWKNGVHFWFDLQEYHRLFYQETFSPFKLGRQSQFLYSTYIQFGGPMDIAVDLDSQYTMYQKLDPPFEDLFDIAEEYILTMLLIPWMQMLESDKTNFKKQVELMEETRYLDSVYYRKLQALRQKNTSLQKQVSSTPEPSLSESPALSGRSLWGDVPEQFRNVNLNTLLRNRTELEHFSNFLPDGEPSMDLRCWMDIEQYRRMPHKDKTKREDKVKEIKNKYMNKKYFFGPNSPASLDQQQQVKHLAGGAGKIAVGAGKIIKEKMSAPALVAVQKHAQNRIEKKWLPQYLATPNFSERQKNKLEMEDVDEESQVPKSKKKKEAWKDVDSNWISSSKEAIAFRKALSNKATCQQFQHFVSLKGDYLENGVLFWLEVQKYKDLCHSHCDDAVIQNKITTIVNCFINSSIPPALQIDIPPEQAERILLKRRELGPYVFQEAETTVFGVLFKLWGDFCNFKSNVEEQKVLSTLEKKKVKQLEKLKRRMKEEEKRIKGQGEPQPIPAVLGAGQEPARDGKAVHRREVKDSRKKASIAEDLFGDRESMFIGSLLGGHGLKDLGHDAYNLQMSWSYSKYMEALEQERLLLQMHSEHERASSTVSSNPETSSVHSSKSEATRRTKQSTVSIKPHGMSLVS
ncbi:regulator of G-protein signaling 22 isoform X1 [Erpetoichthys calabaricus]|uniref:regulator of G-protein signaling 22 isoform X1 n=1 Tax=Erpetoichthys calabaricus TaxID=27687 RepID=UPI00223470A1|nr:regulator of G-protein signaling 22 isoform X1 [Erpetoichthys calabaricus]